MSGDKIIDNKIRLLDWMGKGRWKMEASLHAGGGGQTYDLAADHHRAVCVHSGRRKICSLALLDRPVNKNKKMRKFGY